MFNQLVLAARSSRRNLRRSLLTVVSISLSLCLLGVLMALFRALFLDPGTSDQALRLITRHRVSLANLLPESYGERIRTVPGVRDVMMMQWFGGVYIDTSFKNFFARFAVEPEKIPILYPEYSVPPEQMKAFQSERTACLVGRALADRLGWKLGDRVTIEGDIFPITVQLTIRAIYDARRDNENLMFHYRYLRESVSWSSAVGTYVILARDAASVPGIARAVDAMFRNSPAETKTETERAFELSFVNYMGNVKLYLAAFSGAIMFMLLMVSGNTMAMSVRERVREIAVLKTLGFTPRSVLGMILAESVMICLAGAVLGLALAQLGCLALAQTPITFVDLKLLRLTPAVAVVGLAIAAVIGVLSSVSTAWTAAHRPIVDCLRVVD